MIMRNKKADVAITLLVVLVLFLAGVTLYIFLTQSNGKAEKIADARILDSIYVEEEQIKFFLESLIRNKAKESYVEIKKIEVEDIKEKIKEELEKDYVYDAKEDKLNLAGMHPGGYDYWYLPFEKQSLPKIRERVKNDEFSLELDNGVLKFSLKNFQIQRRIELLDVLYSTDINIEIYGKEMTG